MPNPPLPSIRSFLPLQLSRQCTCANAHCVCLLVYFCLFVTDVAAVEGGKWLAVPADSTRRETAVATVGSLSIMAGVYALTWYLFHYQNGGALIPSPRLDPTLPPPSLGATIGQLAGSSVCLGVLCVLLSYAYLELGRRYFNSPPSAAMKAMVSAAYTVYLVHPWVVNAIVYSWVLLMNNKILPARNSTNPIQITFPFNKTVSATDYDDDGLVVASWFYVALSTNLIVWPTAWALKQLPVLRDVL